MVAYSSVLVLATLDSVTQIASFLISICVMSPKVVNASTVYGLSPKRYVSAACIAGNGQYLTCPGLLGQHNTNMVISICVVSLKVARASTVLSVAEEIHTMEVYLYGDIQ
jgi:hypothetical protein